MSGETQKDESGLTVDTLKLLMDERKEHAKDLRVADQKLQHQRDKNYRDHFIQLNENAKRTIEERGHFVANEAFTPFRDQVLKYMANNEGQTRGSDITMGKIYAAIAAFAAIVGIVVLIANGKL